MGWWPATPADDDRPALLDLDAAAVPSRPEGRRPRRGTVALGAAAVLLAGAGGWGALALTGGRGDRTPTVEATTRSPGELATAAGTAFLTGWEKSDYPAMQALVADPKDSMVRAYGGMATRLDLSAVDVTPGALDPDGVTLPFHAVLTVRNQGSFSYDGRVRLTGTPAGYRVAFTSDTVYPGLTVGQRLDLVDSSRVEGLPVEPAPPAPSTSAAAGATPSASSTPTGTGTVGSARGKLLDRNGKPVEDDEDLRLNVLGRVGDSGGSSGLQRALEDQLAGASGLAVAIVEASTGSPVRVVALFAGEAADDLRTTLDLGVQRAAEQAIAGFDGKAALVAIDAPSGEIRAIANTPVEGLPPALATRYAPGSTFKVITATAALLHGKSTSSTVSCPDTISAGGVVFHNHERSPRSSLSLTEAFARSCNTAFIGLARDLPDGALVDAAALYGFGADALLPIAAVTGSLPAPDSPQEAAADAIGQGRVGASPLVMATVAAAVADGTWRQPHLFRCPACASHRIPVAGSLRTLMRAVVTSGTGSAVDGVPGGPVYGKTGTAEYGSGDPPPTHAWFIGWQGRTAFAVFVEDGSSGGAVAAPVAARFLRLIGGG